MVVRRSVSVPDDLAKRMDQVDGVNWSGLAQSVWESECRRHEEGRPAMAARIQELRAERLELTDAARKAGQQWAATEATYSGLLELVALDSSVLHSGANDPAMGWGELVADAAFGEGNWDRADVEQFCDKWLGVQYPDPTSVAGFLNGAVRWFEDHRHLIENDG